MRVNKKMEADDRITTISMYGLAIHTQIEHIASRSSKFPVLTENHVTQFSIVAEHHKPYLQMDDLLGSKQHYTEI